MNKFDYNFLSSVTFLYDIRAERRFLLASVCHLHEQIFFLNPGIFIFQ